MMAAVAEAVAVVVIVVTFCNQEVNKASFCRGTFDYGVMDLY